MAFLGKLTAHLAKRLPTPQNSPGSYFRAPPTLILPLFSISAAVIGFLIWTDNPLKILLRGPWISVLGWGCLILAAVSYWLPRLHFSWGYDLFCTASLLLWVSSWQEVYRLEAPIFRLYPLYFVALTLVVTYTLIRNRELNQVENENTQLLRLALSSPFLHPLVFFSITSVSIAAPDYYLAYPTFTGLLLVRYALSECFYNQPIAYIQTNRELFLSPLFRRSIYPAAHKYGPILILVPRPPSPTTTSQPVRYKKATVAWITEEQWQQWLPALKRCFVVFLDLRQAQQIPASELHTVCARIPHHRIVVFCDDASELLIPSDVLSFSTTQLKSQQALQPSLEQWFKRLLHPRAK
jgi:hypothetical protein